jgi:hypothetical protein
MIFLNHEPLVPDFFLQLVREQSGVNVARIGMKRLETYEASRLFLEPEILGNISRLFFPPDFFLV